MLVKLFNARFNKVKRHGYLYKFIIAILFSYCLVGCDQLARIDELPIARGHTAKQLCSTIFNTGLDPKLVQWRFIAPEVSLFPLIWQTDIDWDKKEVTVSDFVFLNETFNAKAIYREGVGCTTLVEKTPEQLAAEEIYTIDPPELSADEPWPNGKMGVYPNVIPGLDYESLELAVENAFIENREVKKHTTSLLVAYDGKLIAERYAMGVTADSPVVGWSMTKSITGALIGLLVDEGRIDLDQKAPIPGWEFGDKSTITIGDLMHMASGLDYVESNAKLSNSTRMLYLESDQVDYMSGLELIHEPGTVFNYSTGNSNLLAKIVQDSVGGTAQDAYDFYQTNLFHKADIRSAFIEFDESGQFVGGAYGFMSPRDWLRLGQLYLQRGVWKGEQVIPEYWIDYTRTPSDVNPVYGGQVWVNTNQEYFEETVIPEDTYLFAGHNGQAVVIVPSRKLVLVRTGVFRSLDRSIVGEVLEKVIPALPN